MRKITCVTFPRSGHHMLINVLLKYFSGNLNYLETGGDKTETMCVDVLTAGDLQYCEFYKHCEQIPCSNPKTNFQKNHDFGLKLPQTDKDFYIVLYRHPLESIVSIYNYYLNNNISALYASNINFNKEGWLAHANKSIILWKDFVKKWVVGKWSKNYLFMSYEEMVDFPLISFVNIINFIDPGKKIDLKLLNLAIKKLDISRRHDIKNFQYFDSNTFQNLEKMALEEIKSLGLDLKFN